MGCHTLHAPPGDLLNPGIKPRSPTLKADSLPFEPQGKPQLGANTLIIVIASWRTHPFIVMQYPLIPLTLFYSAAAAAAAAAKSPQSCPTLRPHRRQPTRLPRPWDSPGKNTGVGCQFLLQFMKVKSESEVAQSCLAPSNPMDCSLPGSSIYGIFQARVLEWDAIAFSDFLILEYI